ncbi:DUF427 domain-containing protein [Billgrantia diversa]|uniref:DUF427 domain-containing protein n=1 Tax=Halomonas sp. MCCC 1A13316 TaxID=2733487 RepID=UPI0018A461AD|nr:DUF427 domain-containing protein [Halomonas sp. MCCC 1A13316]QOR40029.1 DUF427 domain-containing protein [Halomonas sp. MCCC 1A13316]
MTTSSHDSNHDPKGRISLHSHDRRVQVRVGDVLLADTRNALELRETGYPPRLYLPWEDVDMARLQRTDTVTHCPFKGDANYFSVVLDGESLRDVAWSYETPFEAMSAIAGKLAFDTQKVDQHVRD